MQALHRKLDVVIVQILRYNCSETDYSFCEDSPLSRTPPSTRMQVSPLQTPSTPHTIFFSLHRPSRGSLYGFVARKKSARIKLCGIFSGFFHLTATPVHLVAGEGRGVASICQS